VRRCIGGRVRPAAIFSRLVRETDAGTSLRILRTDREYSRRHFIAQLAKGAGAAGVLMPSWKAIASTGDISKAYPDELLSIEGYTKGRIKTGDEINASNVEVVKDVLEPIRY